jgi:predicted acetyltransferase
MKNDERSTTELPRNQAEAGRASSEVRVLPIVIGDREVLRHLVDLYAYDFSAFMNLDVEETGRFAFEDLSHYWNDPLRHPFFVRSDGKLAGFALVHERSRLSGTSGIHDMAEFFILRNYRRRGVGERAAKAIFDRLPGSWEIRQRSSNVDAVAFWRRVIERYTHGAFREVTWHDEIWQGPVQFFTTPARNA